MSLHKRYVVIEEYEGNGNYHSEALEISESEALAADRLKAAFGNSDITNFLDNLTKQRNNMTISDIYEEMKMANYPISIPRRMQR